MVYVFDEESSLKRLFAFLKYLKVQKSTSINDVPEGKSQAYSVSISKAVLTKQSCLK